ncbi:hypothetical protein [Limnoglobus roseus]|uniref:Uncharacterized protein n=1 Tax=Limnoglobus roseus TaxID=2598579 RepID=A0A5C1AH08_9BACT|nr:hypothetical protein [Limnoglobus roseus]QEL18501.1 hypothetical protein PX52LOC_05527 [Limnoglobus roseus]
MSSRTAPNEPMSPLEHFLTTLFAVWIGAMLAGTCLFFGGRAWVRGEITQAAEKSSKEANENLKKWQADRPADTKLSDRLKKATDQLEADQKKLEEAFRPKDDPK